MLVVREGSSGLLVDFGCPERVPDDNEGPTLSPGSMFSFLRPLHPLQGPPLAAQLLAVETFSIARPNNVLHGKVRAVYGMVSWTAVFVVELMHKHAREAALNFQDT